MTTWTKRSDASTIFTSRGSTNVYLPSNWTVATRPTSATVGDAINGFTGYNTDFEGLETYVETTGLWQILFGSWTTATRPDTTYLNVGSKGYNSELAQEEMWDGTNWVVLG